MASRWQSREAASKHRFGEDKSTAMAQRDKFGTPAQSDRADRLRAALRENLKRRKAQAKGRAQESDPESPENPGEGASGPPSGPRPRKGAG